jgi:hypothetical protein
MIQSPKGNSAPANSGQGANISGFNGGVGGDQITWAIKGTDGAEIVAGAVVVAGSSIAVVVGDGGLGTYNGGSGYVWIEYY